MSNVQLSLRGEFKCYILVCVLLLSRHFNENNKQKRGISTALTG